MEPRLFIHIGLPKTATTTLQKDVFPSVCEMLGWHYAGLCFPRVWEFDRSTIHGALMLGMRENDHQSLRCALLKSVPQASPVVLLEEMITVTTQDSTWKQNLENLRKMVEGFDYRILVTLRNPADAIFSYYVERYDYFFDRYGKFGRHLIDGEEFPIFRYASFLPELEAIFGEKRVSLATFEAITGRDLSEIERFLGAPVPSSLKIEPRNQKKRTRDGIQLNTKGNLYLASHRLVSRMLRGGMRRAVMSAGRHCRPLFRGIRWDRHVKKPPEKEMAEIRELIAPDCMEYDRLRKAS